MKVEGPVTLFAGEVWATFNEDVHISISGDNEWIAFTSKGNPTGENGDGSMEIFLTRTNGEDLRQLTDRPGDASDVWGRYLRLNHDGTRMWFSGSPVGQSASFLKLQTQPLGQPERTFGTAIGAKFLISNDFVDMYDFKAEGVGSGYIERVDQVTFEKTRLTTEPVMKAELSGDGRWLVAAHGPLDEIGLDSAGVAVISTADGLLQSLADTGETLNNNQESIAISQDGSWVVYAYEPAAAYGEPVVRLVRRDTGATTPIAETEYPMGVGIGGNRYVAWNHFFGYSQAEWKRETNRLVVYDIENSRRNVVLNTDAHLGAPVFSADGTVLAVHTAVDPFNMDEPGSLLVFTLE